MKKSIRKIPRVISVLLCAILALNILAVPCFCEDGEKNELSRIELMKKLDILDSIFLTSEEGHQLYATLLGSTVKTVLDNKAQIVSQANVDPDIVDKAGDTTAALRTLLTEYRKINDDEEKFEWYKENYEEVTENFNGLYESLFQLYDGYRSVRIYLGEEEKDERYAQFVSQLYVTSVCLDDSVTLSEDWTMKNYNLENALEKEFILKDENSSSPLEYAWPEGEILKGDINGDGYVDASDLTILARHVAKIEIVSGPLLDNADVNSDSTVDAQDLTLLARYVAKIINEFPTK